jgi:hypothetical protein
LVNEVIENFDLQPGYFNQNQFSKEETVDSTKQLSRTENASSEFLNREYFEADNIKKINEYLGENNGIESPTSKVFREKRIKMISEFDNNLLNSQLLEIQGLDMSKRRSPGSIHGSKEEEILGYKEVSSPRNIQNKNGFQEKETNLSMYPSIVRLVSPENNFTTQFENNYSLDQGLLNESVKPNTNETDAIDNQNKDDSISRKKSVCLELDESIMDIVIQNFEQVDSKNQQKIKQFLSKEQINNLSNQSKNKKKIRSSNRY